MNATRLLIVDDHMIIRRGLIQILAENPAVEVAGEAADGAAAMRVLRQRPVDVVLLDIALGERDGLDVLRTIRSEFPRVAVIMLSVYPESQFALRALRGGAAAYLNKGASPDELSAAIARVAGGALYITAEVAELMMRDLRHDVEKSPHEALSNREFQVLQLLAQGHAVGEIAAQLSLSANTISTYRARIFDKLGLRTSVDVVAYAARHQLVRLGA
ncbi:MAG: response regulator transcription factor [Rhodocyclaceae bacterium]